MRKRLTLLVMSLTAVAVLVPSSPASATSCYVEDPVDAVVCILYGTPKPQEICNKTPVC